MIKKYIFLLIASVFMLSGCKPTEKGYKAAYDAALNKREAMKSDLGVDAPAGELQQVDGAQLRVVDGVKVYLLSQRIRPADESKKLPGEYNVAVGEYKMITNTKAQSEALIEEGYEAFPAKDTEGMYYTIAGSFPTLSEAVKFYEDYRNKKDRVYVGLPNAPVIIFSPI